MESNELIKKEDVINIMYPILKQMSESPRLCGSVAHEILYDVYKQVKDLPSIQTKEKENEIKD